ncbi:MAG: hypothetical protein KDJ49_02460 [Alphaproteobacteria bacterium]|nr:hypothetical protein [Alphaproteobacteria bacterium]
MLKDVFATYADWSRPINLHHPLISGATDKEMRAATPLLRRMTRLHKELIALYPSGSVPTKHLRLALSVYLGRRQFEGHMERSAQNEYERLFAPIFNRRDTLNRRDTQGEEDSVGVPTYGRDVIAAYDRVLAYYCDQHQTKTSTRADLGTYDARMRRYMIFHSYAPTHRRLRAIWALSLGGVLLPDWMIDKNKLGLKRVDQAFRAFDFYRHIHRSEIDTRNAIIAKTPTQLRPIGF